MILFSTRNLLSQLAVSVKAVQLCKSKKLLRIDNLLKSGHCCFTQSSWENSGKWSNVTTTKNVSEKFVTIFKYPLIKYVRLISRFKVYQLGFMGIFMFPIYSSYSEGAISKLTLYSAFGGCAGVSLAFIIFSYFSTKLVGQFAINDEKDMLRIARLTFYGSKTYDYVKIDNIVPWGDRNEDTSKFMQRLYTIDENDSEKVFIYSLKYGFISDEDLFSDVLGIHLD